MEDNSLEEGQEMSAKGPPNGAQDRKQRRPPTVEVTQGEGANLVPLFSKEELKNIGQRVYDDYVSDVKSRSGRMKKHREFIELYAGLQKAKSFPWQNAANVNIPILTYPSLQVHARLFDMVWPENGKVIYSAPRDLSDFARAGATEKFANSYIRTKMPEMGTGLDDTLAQLCIFGSAFRRTYWSTFEGRVCSDWIPIEDFVVAHSFRSQDPSMRDVPRYTLVQHMTIWDLEMYEDRSVFFNVKGLRAEDEDQEDGSELKETTMRVDGLSEGEDESDQDKPRMVLEQHRIWRMPNSPKKHVSFDGKPHYVVITIDSATKRVLSVLLREEDDPDDVKRFQREATMYQDYAIKRQAYESEISIVTSVVKAAESLGRGLPMGFKPPEPPSPPFGTDKSGAPVQPLPVRKRQICFFTHYRAFPSEGFYGLGFGDFLAPLAKAANTLINQHINGVTLRNSKPGFISRQLRTARGAINTEPGRMIEVDAPPAALKEGIVWMDPPQNDSTTMPLVNMISGMGDKLAGSSDILSGSTSGANRTAKEIQILNAQLMKQISVLARRVKEAFKHEIDKIWRCWGVFLPEEPESMPVVGDAGQPEELPISRSMFVPDARVMPASDPRMKFERVEETMNVFGVVMNNPMLAQNPMVLRAATEDVLRAHDADRMVGLMGPPPQPPQPPPPMEPFREEAGWLRSQDHPPHPTDDDQAHLQSHMAFINSPAGKALSPDGRKMAEAHIRATLAAIHEKSASGGQSPMGPPQMGPPGGMPPQMGPQTPPHGGPMGMIGGMGARGPQGQQANVP